MRDWKSEDQVRFEGRRGYECDLLTIVGLPRKAERKGDLVRVPRIKTLSIRMLLATTFVVACLPNDAVRAAETAADLTVSEKAYVGSRIYSSIEMYFAHWEAIPELDLNKAYKDYLERALAAKDRREFDLDTFEFVAKLHNAHSSFWDEWLGKEYGQPVGFEVCVLQGKWVIWRTQLPDVKIGDVINGIDGEPIESFFQSHKKYVNASSESAARNGLFYMPYLFPENFTITLEGGRQARVDREHQKLTPQAPSKTEGRTMASGAVGYMRIPSFDDPAFEEEALNVIKSFSGLARLWLTSGITAAAIHLRSF